MKITLDVKGAYFVPHFQFEWSIINAIKEVPNRKYDTKDHQWLLPINLLSIKELKSQCFWSNIEIIYTDSAQKKINELEEKKKKNEEKIKNVSALKTQLDVDIDLQEYLKVNLFPYQKIGYKFLELSNGTGIIADEPGLGKTIQSISYAIKYCKNILVICPASLKLNWQSEIHKFTKNAVPHVLMSGDKVTISDGSVPHFTIINFELLSTHKRGAQPSSSILENISKFDCVIIDEAHRIKNRSAKVTKWVHKHLISIKHRTLLTGTPIKSRPIEYFSLLRFIDKERWNNYAAYGIRYCNGFNGRFGYDFSGASNLQELYQEISPYMIRRQKMDVLKELPDKIYTRTPIPLDGPTKKAYKKLEGTYQEEANGQNKTFHLSKLQEMKQLTSNFKLDYAKEFIESLIDAGQKVVVFSQYVDIVRSIHNYFHGKSVVLTGDTPQGERFSAVNKFQNDDNTFVFCGTIGAAGVGLTLTAANNVLFIDLPWTPGDFEQACDRCHRIGQKNSVNIIMLECEQTIDTYIGEVLESKKTVISQVLDNEKYVSSTKTSILDDVIRKMSQTNKKKKIAKKK